MKGKTALAALIVILLLWPGLQTGSDAKAPSQNKSVFGVNRFDDSQPAREVSLLPGTTDDSTRITIPSNAQIVNASLELTSLPYTDGATDYPLEPEMDIGADGKSEWAFKGFGYGQMGYQENFHDGFKTAKNYNLTFSGGEERLITTRLPKNATLMQASMRVGGWPTPFWRDPVRVTPGTGSPGESTPCLYESDDRLWIAWATEDPAISDGTDSDIVVSYSFDGVSWAPPYEITPRGDVYEDDSPDIIAYGGKIWVVWSSAQSDSAFAPCNVYIRPWNGTKWEETKRLSPSGLRYLNDWPQLETYKDRLFCFWKTTDPAQAHIANTDDMDMIFRSYDGLNWAPVQELTPDWSDEIDWSLNIIKFNGELWAFWDMDVDMSERFTVDIFYKRFDGEKWSDAYNIIPQPDAELDEIPKLAVYRNTVTGKDELWVCWIRGSPSMHDLDIMARRYDGSSWGPMIELTTPGERKDNMGQEILEYNHRLYVVWVTGTNTSTEVNSTIAIYSTYGDIVIRAWDGYRWSERMELTPGEENDNANSPTIAVFNNKLYVGWAYPYPPPPGGKETWDIIVRNIDFRPVELEMDMGNDGISDWGPSELQSTNEKIPIYSDELQKALNLAAPNLDLSGNEYCDISIRVRSAYPSEVAVKNLSITYSLTVRFENLSDSFNEALRSMGGLGRTDQNITLPIRFFAASAGKLRISNLNLTYILNLAPQLLEDLPGLHLPEDTDLVRALDLEDFFWDDWDDGRLVFELTYEEEGTRIHCIIEDGRYLTFTTPMENWYGTRRFQLRAFDRARLWAESNVFNITVDPVNDPPVLDPVADQKIDVGGMIRFVVHATDVDNDTLGFSTDNRKFSILPWAGGPDYAQARYLTREAGTYYVNVTVDDGNGGTDWQLVKMIVRDRTSSSFNDLCLSWLLIILLAMGAVVAAEWYRRKYLKETGPDIDPEKGIDEEELFGGRVKTVRTEQVYIDRLSEELDAIPERTSPLSGAVKK